MAWGRAAAAALVTAFALLIVLWGSSSGEHLVLPPQGTVGAPDITPTAPSPTVATATAEPRQPLEEGSGDLPWETILIGLTLLVVLLTLLRWLLARDWEPEEVDLEQEPDEVALLLEATSAERRSRALAEGDPRNAVVACWVSLEDAAERAGVARDPAETSAEFTTRVLAAWQVDPRTVATLADLYREARFSRHPVTEQMRSEAVAALEEIHAAVSRRAVP